MAAMQGFRRLWIGGKEEGVEAELLGASARLGVAGGHGYGDDDGELRSVAGGETEERGGGRSRERGRSERGSGLRGVAGGTREGGGSQAGRRWPPRPRACEHAAAPTGKRKTIGGSSGGGLGRFWWAARVRPGKSSLSLLFFSSVLFYLISFCHCFEF